MAGFAAALLLALGGAARATRAATPVDGTWQGTHALQLTGSLEGGFTVKAAESYTINRVCTVAAGTVLEQYTPKGGSAYEVRWLSVWVPMNPDAPGAKCDFVFDGGPATVTISGSGRAITIKDCPGDACSLSGTTLTRKDAPPADSAAATTAPAPAAADQPWAQLKLDYEMPSRYGQDANGDDEFQLSEIKPVQAINPPAWTARVMVTWPQGSASAGPLCPPAAGARRDPDVPDYSFWVGDPKKYPKVYFKSLGRCVFEFARFPKLGDYRVTVKAARGGKVVAFGELVVKLKDFLVVGLGDSNGSGEGNPDVAAGYTTKPVWQDARCDRSHFSFQAQTAARLELASRHSSVTFVHLACSGASITTGLLKGYTGVDPSKASVKGFNLPSQIEEMARLTRGRTADAVLLSVGVNDLGFGPMVKFCIDKDSCFLQKGFDPRAPRKTLNDAIASRIAGLAKLYRQLDAKLAALTGVPPDRVFVTQYFDSFRNSAGKICYPLISTKGGHYDFSGPEAGWAQGMLVRLNAAIATAAQGQPGGHGWTLVAAPSAFTRHGYCAKTPWIRSLTESFWQETESYWSPKFEGAMHANVDGHIAQANGLYAVVFRKLLAQAK